MKLTVVGETLSNLRTVVSGTVATTRKKKGRESGCGREGAELTE